MTDDDIVGRIISALPPTHEGIHTQVRNFVAYVGVEVACVVLEETKTNPLATGRLATFLQYARRRVSRELWSEVFFQYTSSPKPAPQRPSEPKPAPREVRKVAGPLPRVKHVGVLRAVRFLDAYVVAKLDTADGVETVVVPRVRWQLGRSPQKQFTVAVEGLPVKHAAAPGVSILASSITVLRGPRPRRIAEDTTDWDSLEELRRLMRPDKGII